MQQRRAAEGTCVEMDTGLDIVKGLEEASEDADGGRPTLWLFLSLKHVNTPQHYLCTVYLEIKFNPSLRRRRRRLFHRRGRWRTPFSTPPLHVQVQRLKHQSLPCAFERQVVLPTRTQPP